MNGNKLPFEGINWNAVLWATAAAESSASDSWLITVMNWTFDKLLIYSADDLSQLQCFE